MQHLYYFARPFLAIACLVLFLSNAAFGQTITTGGTGLFGDGSDGDVAVTVNTTMNRDMYYHDLTIKAGKTLDTGGFRVFVSGKLTLGSGARLSRDGNSNGVPLSAGTLGGSGSGHIANSLGGSGGGWEGGYSGIAWPPEPSVGGRGVFRSALQAISGRSLDGELVLGGVLGISGGSGGGVVVLAARTVVALGDGATISANGGEGKSGCGGGGGVAVVITTSAQPVGVTLTASGGTAYSGCVGVSGFSAWLN